MSELTLFFGVLAIGALVLASLFNWRFGLFGLLIYLPFAGLISLRSGQSTIALLAKDVLFIIPAYISFFLINRRWYGGVRLPTILVLALVSLALLIVC